MREGKNIRTQYRLFYCDEKGDWMLEPGPRRIFIARIPPACDDELLVSAGPSKKGMEDATLGLYVWQLAEFRKEAAALQKGPLTYKDRRGRTLLKFEWDVMGHLSHEGAAWHKPGLRVNALALSRNAVLVAHGMYEEHKVTWGERISRTLKDARSPNLPFKGWKLTAFSRDGKETLWEVDLPQEPLFSGLAIARDGSVLVTLRDGSIVCVRKE
jgi:hypothetical protein